MRESRNGLRPVKAKLYQEELTGYFHCFCQEGSIEDGIGTFAIIELMDGTIKQVDACTVKFEDVK